MFLTVIFQFHTKYRKIRKRWSINEFMTFFIRMFDFVSNKTYDLYC